jgi:hypothetical protein
MGHRFLILSLVGVLAFMMAALFPPSRGHAAGGTKWAVIVGINDYLKEVTPLHCAIDDAKEFKKALIDKAGFSESNVFLLTSDLKGNKLPDRTNIVRWISQIKSQAKPEDTFIFFFSGHGITTDGESYLVTYESDPYSKDTLEMSALKIGDLRRIMEEMPAGKILLFIDACRNDPRSGKGDTDNRLTSSQSKGLIINKAAGLGDGASKSTRFAITFFSCGIGERSYEWSEEGLGFFTYYLTKGLGGDNGALDDKGNVTLGSLKKYIAREVPDALKRERGTSTVQIPWTSGNATADADNWIISTRQGLKTVLTVIPPDRNILGNGGFEAGMAWPWGTGQYSQLAKGRCWWNSTTCQSTAGVDNSERHEGARSLHIVNPSPRTPHVYGTMAQRVVIKRNSPYKITLWAKGKNLATRGAASIIVDERWGTRPIVFPRGDFDWQQFEGTFTLDADEADLRIISEDRGELWIDDVRLCPAGTDS